MDTRYIQKAFLLSTTLILTLIIFSPIAEACNLFNWSDCNNSDSVIYCNDGQDCSLDAGTAIVSHNIKSIEQNRRFSDYIQDVVAYLLLFIGIVGVLYIIYAGFNILTSGGDEDKVKKSKTTIFHVFIGLLLIFLAYSIVRFVIGSGGTWGVLNNAFKLPSLIETTYAYTDYDTNTFDYYKKEIELLSSTLDREYQVNNKITSGTLTKLQTLVTASMNTFPDSDNVIFNTNLANALITSIELVKKSPDSNTAITSLARGLNDYLTKIKIQRIKGKITASPEKGNAPLTVTLRASEIVDPSGVTIPKGNFIWWIRAAGGTRTVIGTGPSLAYKFSEERNYTVFLNIISASRNAKGKTDVLPFNSSININVLPRVGNIYLAINGKYVSNEDTIKFTPAVGRQWLLFDAAASTPASGTTFTYTTWDFGNGNIVRYTNGPSISRQVFANEGIYKMKLDITTNENQHVIKEMTIEIRDPIASIRANKTEGSPQDDFHFSAYTSTSLDLWYGWQVVSLDDGKLLYTSNLQNITYKFKRTGKYAVKLRTVAPNGREDIDTTVVNIEGRDPVAFFDFKSASTETPNTILFDATKSYDPDNLDASNLNFSWIIDGDRVNLSNSSRNGSIGKFTFNTVGTHHVVLEVTNKEGKMISYNKDISIDSLLSVKLIISPKISTVGSPVTFIADAREAQAFEWQFGDGENDISTRGRITHIYKKSGIFDASLTIRGKAAQSTNTISRKVYVMSSNNPFAIITLKRDNEEIIQTPDACDGKEAFVIDRSKAITMSAENSVNIDGTNAGLSYTWKYGSRNSSQKEFSYKFDELGCFPVTLTVRSQKTLKTSSMTSYIKIENLAPRLSSLSVTPTKVESDPVTVTVTANNAADDDGAIVSYIWYYYTEDDPEPQDFRITRSPKTVFVLPRVTGKYFFAVILEDSNGTKINSEDITSERFSLSLTSDSINTPIISLKTSNTNIAVGQKVDFGVTVKNILGSDIASKAEYKWDYNGDGFYEETTNVPASSHTYDAPGSFNAKVKVTYKGVSNTKYQTIVVKNEISPNLEYVAIGKKFVFFNTTRGLYTSAKWRIGDVTSTNPTSFVYDAEKEGTIPTNIKLEVSDGTLNKSITTPLKKDVLNALRLKRNEDKLVYFSYPLANNDIIHVSDPTDKVFVYLGESKGTIAKYAIDTDTRVDSDLNGETWDDIDNRGTDSATNGSPFVIKNTDSSIKERLIRLTIYDGDRKVIGTKDVKIIYDFVDDSMAQTLSGSLDNLPKDISEIDKANIEKLKDLIRNTKEQDRLKMMQYLALLQENWFDTREKTKIIIDFENYIDTSSPIDAKTKEEFYSILEGFLMTDNQIKDDITLATKVLKSLIPKTNPSYTQIMKNIDEILSHPTNITLNKELGKFILEAVKNDSTINNQDKLTIKSQLEVIINGGQNNVPISSVAWAEESSSPILGFIIGFLKLFGYLLLFILAVFLGGFIYFKVFNKDENIGFQDFLIDKLFHKKSDEDETSDILASFKPTPPVQESTPVVDPLQTLSSSPKIEEESTLTPESFTSSEPTPEPESISESESTSEVMTELEESQGSAEVSTEPTELESGIPDWLKQTTSLAGMEEESTTETPESEVMPESEVIPESEPTSEPEMPPEATEEVPTEPTTEPETETPPETPSDDLGELPAWMSGMNQDAFQEELQETLSPTPVASEEESVETDILSAEPTEVIPEEPTAELPPPDDSIPDWLRASTLSTPEVTEEIQKEKSETEKKKTPVKHTEKTPNEKKESHNKWKAEHKKDTKKKEEVKKEDAAKEDTTPKPKKEKAPTPTPNVSAPEPKLPDDEDLPDWLK